MLPTKEKTPFVPISINEIIEDVHQAYKVGITMVHLHARDEVTGIPTHKAEVYAKIIEGIRIFAPDLIICASLSGRNYSEFDKRAEVLYLDGAAKPDMGSLTLSSLNFNKNSSINEPEMIMKLAQAMLELGIKPELEAFDAGMINYAKYLIKKQLIKPPFYFNLIFGNIACAQPDLLHAGVMINDLPDNSICSLGGIGDAQIVMNSIAVAMGYGVRIGIEDNIYFDSSRSKLSTNMEFLERIHDIIIHHDKEVMASNELRKLFNMPH